MKKFANDVINSYVEYLEKEHICETLTDTSIKLLSSYIGQDSLDIQRHHQELNYIVSSGILFNQFM